MIHHLCHVTYFAHENGNTNQDDRGRCRDDRSSWRQCDHVPEVVRHTETPRGSIARRFQGGKQQLIEEAVSFAGKAMAVPLDRMLKDKGAIEGLGMFIASWRKHLEATNFGSGCPVLAVCLEEVSDKQDVVTGDQEAAEQARLLNIADAVFADWRTIIAKALQREGISASRAKRLATLAVAAVRVRSQCAARPAVRSRSTT